ncbi:2-amino-4-ketopentanoate thiolase [Fusibacter paucivorans]|uniref:2-amino-4-ketopentanoate thiolase n=1 Tax=Fusibacter paucivorans TaxID=76009 RepID=A0ABS5PRG1_9FIRM|nr:2-amino-4-oxopentanoate thiolase subunit OrtA [Fusibacter paucivorans]MBS7527744.1 2-amino-4-ketopentanoate thiolase [Fusibacter paucivorans]
MTFKKGTWIRIKRVVMQSEERTAQIPEDTRRVPLEMWVKGFAEQDGHLGDTICVRTLTGRVERGEVVEIEPVYGHDFGQFIPEILTIGITLRKILDGGEHCDES